MRRLAFLFLAQCGLFPSVGDLTGGDASVVEAGADVGVDADAGAEAEAGRFCDGVTPKPAFCEDYDEDAAPIPSSFESYSVNGGATMTIVTDDVRSGPRALLVATPPLASGSVNDAYYPTIGDVPTTATLGFDVKVDPGDGDVVFNGFVTNNGTALLLVIGPPGIAIQEGAYATDPMYPRHPRYPVVWSKGWVHIDLKLVHASDGHAKSSLSIDGVAVETDFVCDSRFVFGPLQLAIGYVFAGSPASAKSARIDNIVAYDSP